MRGGIDVFQSTKELQGMLLGISKQSPTYQKIAIYIEKNYMQIVFMTASELAEASRVSQGSVSRFFMHLGYHGYTDFQRNLQQMVSKQMTGPERLKISHHVGTHREKGSLQTILDVEIGHMASLSEVMQGEAYEAMVSAVADKKPLVLISSRMSATLLPYAHYMLTKIRTDVSVVETGTNQWDTLELLDPENVHVIAVSFPRYPNALIEKCRAIREKGIPIYGLTDSPLSPLVDVVDKAVCVPVTTASLFDIYSTPLAFLNLMIRDAAERMPDLPERIEKLEEIEHAAGVYFTK